MYDRDVLRSCEQTNDSYSVVGKINLIKMNKVEIDAMIQHLLGWKFGQRDRLPGAPLHRQLYCVQQVGFGQWRGCRNVEMT
jgi:hypothetical protein